MQDTARNWSLALYGTGQATEAYGAYVSGVAESDAARANAAVAVQQARQARVRGAIEELRIRRAAASIVGQQRSSYAAQGVRLDTGTPLEAQLDVARLSEQDVLTVRNNAMLEAWGKRQEAAVYRYESRLARRKGITGAFGKLAVGGANLYKSATLGPQDEDEY